MAYGGSGFHDVPPGYRMIVVPFSDSSLSVCTIHPTPCPHKFCTSYWMNMAVIQVTGSNLTHCELYSPHTGLSVSVDSEKNVHHNKDRTYNPVIGRWVFLSLMVTEEQEANMMRYLIAQKGKPYDNTSFYLFGLLSCTKSIQRHSRPLRHEMCYQLTQEQLSAALPPSETCARLLMGAFVFAGIVSPRDVRLATPQSVYTAFSNAGAQYSELLPRVMRSREMLSLPSAFEMASSYSGGGGGIYGSTVHQSHQLGYALSGGFLHDIPDGASEDTLIITTNGEQMAVSHDEYLQASGIQREKSRFVSLEMYR
jgi:hypothetical protein